MKKINYLIFIILFLSFILPSITFAAPTGAEVSNAPSTSYWDSIKNLSICSLWGCSPNQSASGVTSNYTQSNQFNNTQSSQYKYESSRGLGGILTWFGSMLGLIQPLIISVAVVWFVFNVFQYTIRESEDDKEKAKKQIVWGIIGIFVMVSVWGLVNILRFSFRLNNSNINVPSIQSDIQY